MKKLTLAVLMIVICKCGASADEFGPSGSSLSIDFVTVDSPGNEAVGFFGGDVDYTYRIAKFETSRSLVEKSNSAGSLGITMLDPSPSNQPPRPEMPATGISWLEAARFVNWLNESKGYPHAYKFGSQPGEAGYLPEENHLLWLESDDGFDPNNLFRNANAHYFLPSRDEWNKAAYYDPNNETYTLFPNGVQSGLRLVPSGRAPGSVVFGSQAAPADVTQAGGLSIFGVMGMGGNAQEFLESALDGTNDDPTEGRIARHGSWSTTEEEIHRLQVSSRGIVAIDQSHPRLGFRVASVPEPNASLLSTLALLAGLESCRRKRDS